MTGKLPEINDLRRDLAMRQNENQRTQDRLGQEQTQRGIEGQAILVELAAKLGELGSPMATVSVGQSETVSFDRNVVKRIVVDAQRVRTFSYWTVSISLPRAAWSDYADDFAVHLTASGASYFLNRTSTGPRGGRYFFGGDVASYHWTWEFTPVSPMMLGRGTCIREDAEQVLRRAVEGQS